jgi:hypothetical protein
MANPSSYDASFTHRYSPTITRLGNITEDPRPPMYGWPGVNDIITQQDLIGWRAFLEGRVLQAWAAKHQEYYDWLERKHTGKQ